jgi:diguanylate cyclase (GGDEF)-like protein
VVSESPVAPIDHHQAKILVVDDCPRHVDSLVELLRLRHYGDVASVTNPAQVAPLHAAHHYDLILLDLNMPDHDGLAVIDSLKRGCQGTYLPVMIVTGSSSRRKAALAAGAIDVIIKPYDFDELELRMRNILQVGLQYKELAQRVEQHRMMALHDPLTGLPNRRLLLDRADTALQLARRGNKVMAVLYIDLDGFKEVNDQNGHASGDTLLQHVASRLTHCVRQSDTVGRLGGDEFLMILTEVRSPDEVRIPATKIVQSLSKPFVVHGRSVKISASVGIAVYPDHAESIQDLIAQADAALYETKRNGKNGYCFAPHCLTCG